MRGLIGAAGLLACAVTAASARVDNDPDAYVVNFYTGGGSDGVLFAAGTANQQCTNLGAPDISVVSASPGVTLSIRPGSFVVTGTDYGYLVCEGQRMQGTIVTGTGSGQAVIKVTYPPVGQWYTHTLTLPAR
ncbi:hypothetical protein [Aquabacter cavernae]|uniref:hypothetical protein n=1 Tax=Aquabacter cavernae TaxID=2496029 RepID=UPI000F8CD03E|nr:hypothetical protein [Aquabacter cavernae]